MANGLFVRNSIDVNVTGTYTPVQLAGFDAGNASTYAWLSTDKLHAVMYVALEDTYQYALTTDSQVAVNKTYYIRTASGGYEQVVSPVVNSQIYSGTYYERFQYAGWVICEVTTTPTGTINDFGRKLFFAPADVTNNPYDSSIVWYELDAYGAIGSIASALTVTYWDESAFVTEVSDPIIDTDAGTITTVTTTTNYITGEVFRETSIITNKTKYDVDDLTRYTDFNLSIGKIYRFSFVSDFKQLGYDVAAEDQPVNAGIYRLDKVMTYLDMVSNGIDLYANLYQPLKVSKTVYETDLSRLVETTIYRLIDPSDESRVYYMPKIFIKDTPDASVKEHLQKALIVKLGVLGDILGDDYSIIDEVREFIGRLLEKRWGIKVDYTSPDDSASSIFTNSYGSIWMTDREFDKLDNERKRIALDSTIDLVDLFNFDESNIYYKENLKLHGKIAALEQVIVSQSNKLKKQSTSKE